mmetsp:Transcript_31407/g.63298  ORF Transcript_31407/g.63298 Transcript_31407/m.63298 type:complete len:216 (-) Transcript_31407:2771-3418(-)
MIDLLLRVNFDRILCRIRLIHLRLPGRLGHRHQAKMVILEVLHPTTLIRLQHTLPIRLLQQRWEEVTTTSLQLMFRLQLTTHRLIHLLHTLPIRLLHTCRQEIMTRTRRRQDIMTTVITDTIISGHHGIMERQRLVSTTQTGVGTVLAGVGIGIVAMISGGMGGRIQQTTMGSKAITGVRLANMESLEKEAMGNMAITGVMLVNMESLAKERVQR